jgi:EmrB/QacA subfamily drug resistance transporter
MIDRRQRALALLVAGCLVMELLDGTIVTTSAPQIARSLSVSAGAISIVVTAYLVTVAALIPLSGWVSARFGARRVFLAAIALFAFASLGCAAATSLPELVVMRVLQGAGGAMMVPVGRLVVLARTAKADLMTITAYLIWPALLAPVVAPLAGGAITTYANWHWLFLINLPLAALAFAAALRLVPSPPREAPPALDGVGVVLTCTGLVALTCTAALLSGARPSWAPAIACGLASALVILIAVRHLLRAPAPVINLRTLRIPTFRGAVGGLAIFGVVVGAGPFLLPLLFQEVFGWSAVKSGAVVLFLFLGNIAIKPATSYLYGRAGFRRLLAIATAGMAATMVAAALMTAATPLPLIAAIVLLSGIARSVGGTGYLTIVFTDVPPAQMRDANTLQATVQQLSLGFGVAVATILLRLGHPLGIALLDDGGKATAYSIAFVLLACISLMATAGALRLHPTAGDVLRGERATQSADAGRGGAVREVFAAATPAAVAPAAAAPAAVAPVASAPPAAARSSSSPDPSPRDRTRAAPQEPAARPRPPRA